MKTEQSNLMAWLTFSFSSPEQESKTFQLCRNKTKISHQTRNEIE